MMKAMGWGVWVALAAASVGCVPELRIVRRDAGADAVTDGEAGTDATDVVEVADATDVVDASDVVDAPDAAGTGDVVDADAADVVDAADVTDATDVVDVADVVVCAAGETRCDGRCVTTASDAAHCGGCGRACSGAPHATPECRAGACALRCDDGYELAGAACVACGGVDQPLCSRGGCGSGLTNCAGTCRDLSGDGSNCGACGRGCAYRERCDTGRCVVAQRSCAAIGTPGCGTVLVPSGTFSLGGDGTAYYATPARADVHIDPFRMDAYEVTVARFRAFWSARTAELPNIRAQPIRYPGGRTIAWAASAQPPLRSSDDPVCSWTDSAGPREEHPITCIDWWLAQEFCVWDGGRLPTEAEWEYTARGTNVDGLRPGRAYAWGDDPPSARCDRARWNVGMCAGDDGALSRRVGSFAPSGGLWDLTGNVYEWTADNFVNLADARCWAGTSWANPLCQVDAVASRVTRGGSWAQDDLAGMRAASRIYESADHRAQDVGFRCVRSR